jgi:hypothetical protein
MSAYELAQLNVGIIRGPMDSPLMAQFAANLARINALADASPGFVWRLQTEAGDATAIRPFDDENLLLNMSVWRDVESLRRYVYSSAHTEIMRRRREWFERMTQAYLVLWWVPRGHRPPIAGCGLHVPRDLSAAGRAGRGAARFVQRRVPRHLKRVHEARARRRPLRRQDFAAPRLPMRRLMFHCCAIERIVLVTQ